MQCPFCKDPVIAFDKPSRAHVVIGMDEENHVHVHGSLDKKEIVRDMLQTAAETVDISVVKKGAVPHEITFHNRQRIGDILMFTCAIRDFKKEYPNARVNVASTCSHIWDHNPYIDRTLKQNKDQYVKIGPGKGTNQSSRIDWHFANAYRISIEDTLGIQIPQGESRPDIYLTEDEYNSPRPFEKPYWVICISGERSWGCKMYPYEKWQKVVDMNPDLTFVQIGAKEDQISPLHGDNVINHIGKTQDKETGIRDLFKLFLHAEGSIGLVSFHMHLSGALYKPSVVVAGAREPVSFTRYPYHQYLATDGTLPCSIPACWKCDINGCKNLVGHPDKLEKKVPKCVDMITPEEVSAAINRYYIGGLLKKGSPCERPKLKNIVKTPSEPPQGCAERPVLKSNGLEWSHGAIEPKDWEFIRTAIEKQKAKVVLQFGAGLSTVQMSKFTQVCCFETEDKWIDKVLEECRRQNVKYMPTIYKWNGRDLPVAYTSIPRPVDLYGVAFVDGPGNGQNRNHAFRHAANLSKVVLVHDADRTYEKKWADLYLKGGFEGPIKGGKYTHMWFKTPSFVPIPENKHVETDGRKIVRIVSTARGWGGCARSVTTIMKMLLDKGHKVEFVPFRNQVTSREFNDCLKNGLMDVEVKLDYESIREDCDTLFVYADDFVWEFPKMGEHFQNLQARKKIMMVNYRRGKIGELDWTRGWDKYLFLNSGQRGEFLTHHPEAHTGVFPPCTDLSPFFNAKINYDSPVRIVRHSSQGDKKFDKEREPKLIERALEREDLHIHMLPGPSFIKPTERFHKQSRTGVPEHLVSFLEKGNLFWYSLPEGYMDMGPRVILEAMACGLPVIADDWGGAKDRIDSSCGWLCKTKEEMIDIIHSVQPWELKQKGENARGRAAKFQPERWVEELTC